MDFGAHLPLMDFGDNSYRFAHLVAYTDTAARLGFSALSVNDHMVFSVPWLDGPTALAAMVEHSEPMTLATTVSLPIIRGPIPLAKTLTAIDRLSGGRLVVAVGAGSSDKDFDCVGPHILPGADSQTRASVALRGHCPRPKVRSPRQDRVPSKSRAFQRFATFVAAAAEPDADVGAGLAVRRIMIPALFGERLRARADELGDLLQGARLREPAAPPPAGAHRPAVHPLRACDAAPFLSASAPRPRRRRRRGRPRPGPPVTAHTFARVSPRHAQRVEYGLVGLDVSRVLPVVAAGGSCRVRDIWGCSFETAVHGGWRRGEVAMTWAMSRSDYDEMAARYDEGRALPLNRLDGWRRALTGVVSTRRDTRIVDVGSGTGLWSVAFATWFGARVVGVEPSAGMRNRAAAKRPHPRVAYVAGRGDAIPLASNGCSAAWLSTVVHHFRHLETAALELRRVLRPDAPVLIREGFTGRTDGIPWLRYFPEARAITDQLWPTVDDVVTAFAPAGFRFEALEPVAQVTACNRREYADLVRVRADSTLVQLTDDEFSTGMQRLDHDAASPLGEWPVISTLDLLVLR